MKISVLLAFILVSVASLVAAPLTADWSLVPSGDLAGQQGDTITWYYTINNTCSCWLSVDSLGQTSPFQIGTAQQLINASANDDPVLAPNMVYGSSTNPGPTSALISLTIDANAVPYALDSGSFILNFDFWSADPLTDPNANLLGTLEVDKNYSASVQPAAANTPEPSPAALLGIAVLLATFSRQLAPLRRFLQRYAT